MKPLKELRHIDFKLSSTELFFSKIKGLNDRIIDLDVFLPSIGMNLQRGNVWTLEQKQELIMSIFYERYIPPVRIMSLINEEKDSDDIKQVIDGKQRISAMMDFYNNEFLVILEGESFYIQNYLMTIKGQLLIIILLAKQLTNNMINVLPT